MTDFLEIDRLSVALKGGGSRLLRSVSLGVARGEVRGLVGESGAGKSMIGKAILGILPKSVEVVEGTIRLNGTDLLALPPAARRRLIGRSAALIPQDPLTALNPSHRIGPQITDRLVDILGWTRVRAQTRALELLAEVHIPDPARVMRNYPHELSGGMRQRILIASAFAAEPGLIVADEPTTALDVTVQKQILKLIAGMQARHGTTLLFVTHDLGVVSKVCQSISVLYAGKVVEDARLRDFFRAPRHPYSAALLAATPRYTDPEGSLTPVGPEVIAATRAEVDAADKEWRHV
jgi:peptide/nickel transport system ATP-binding protein